MGITFNNPFLLGTGANLAGLTNLGTQSICHREGVRRSPAITRLNGRSFGPLRMTTLWSKAQTSIFNTWDKIAGKYILPNIETINRASLISSGPLTALAHGLLTSIGAGASLAGSHLGAGASSGFIPFAGNIADASSARTALPDAVLRAEEWVNNICLDIERRSETLYHKLKGRPLTKGLYDEVIQPFFMELDFDKERISRIIVQLRSVEKRNDWGKETSSHISYIHHNAIGEITVKGAYIITWRKVVTGERKQGEGDFNPAILLPVKTLGQMIHKYSASFGVNGPIFHEEHLSPELYGLDLGSSKNGKRLHINDILYNLISNAVKYGKPADPRIEQHITIRTFMDRENAVIEVSDNGPGMMPEDLPHWGEYEWRGPAVIEAGIEGQGKGASFVKWTAGQLGGSTHASSAPGEGLKVTVTLPLASIRCAEAKADRAAAIAKAATEVAEICKITDPVEFGRRYLATVDEIIEEVRSVLKKGGGHEGWKRVIKEAIHSRLEPLRLIFIDRFSEDHSLETSTIRHNIIQGSKHTLTLLASEDPGDVGRFFDMISMPVEGDDIHADILRAIRYPRAFAESMKVNIRYDIPRGLHLREGLDRSSFVQQFVDLVWNAVKYHDYRLGDDGKDIKKVRFIRLSWDISCEAFVVEDNGSGIEHPERVFEPLYREAERYKEEIHGTGMGLANTRDYFESIGGKIEVESEVNVGSRFIITPKPGDVIDTSISNRIARAAMDGSDEEFGKLIEEIGAMDNDALLRTAVQMFNVVDGVVEKIVGEFKKVEVDDLEQLNKFSGPWRARLKRINEVLSLLRDKSSNIHHKIIATFNSSISQPTTSTSWTLDMLGDYVGMADLQGAKKFKDLLASINVPKKSVPIDGLGYLIPPSRQELISYVAAAIGFFFSKEKRRDGNDIVFVTPRLLIESKSKVDHIIGINYPPDPAGDIALRTYLDVLGWDLKIEAETETNITYRLNFGKMTLIDENI